MIDKYIKPSIFVQKCTKEPSFVSTQYVHRFVLVGVRNGTALCRRLLNSSHQIWLKSTSATGVELNLNFLAIERFLMNIFFQKIKTILFGHILA
jgi:hypothetical protein